MNTKKAKNDERSVSYEDYLVESLKDPEEALAYLRVSMLDEDPRIFLMALGHVAKANGGLTVLAKRTGLNRENLYRTLSSKGNPKLANIDAVLKALGMKLSLERVEKPAARRKAA